MLGSGEAHPRRALRKYVEYFNIAWPHQGRQQRIAGATQVRALRLATAGTVPAVAVLGGLHHIDRRVCPDAWRKARERTHGQANQPAQEAVGSGRPTILCLGS